MDQRIPKHGRQFSAEIVTQVRPATVEAIKRYLGSGLIKGVGPVTAKRIVDFFGQETLDILDRTPNRLLEVPGVGKHRTGLIGKAWIEQQADQRGHALFAGARHQQRPSGQDLQAVRRSVDLHCQQRPVPARHDIFGIGFRTADKIAQDLGLPPDSPGAHRGRGRLCAQRGDATTVMSFCRAMPWSRRPRRCWKWMPAHRRRGSSSRMRGARRS